MSNTPLPAPGWYPAAHANNELRYWDGGRWVDDAPTAPVHAGAVNAAPATASTPKRSRKGWIIGGSIVAGILVIGAIGSALGGGKDVAPTAADGTPSAPPAAVEPVEEESPEPAPEPEMVQIPDLTGMTAAEAADTLAGLGLAAELTTEDDADVTGTNPSAGTEVEAGASVAIQATEKPKLTVGQENAASKALDYLDYTAFSRSGLIKQLEFEGFTTDEATFGVDYIDADWNAQAEAKAQDYMDYSSFSKQGLIDQLIFEGFSKEQAAIGAAAVGF